MVAGTIPSIGCSAISAYGIEYSLIAGFANGTGTQVASTNLATGSFSSDLTGLVPATTYFYKAYATNAGGTEYGTEQSFTTATPVLLATALTDFGGVCVNTTTAANSFTISSTYLNATNINVGPFAGYSFSTSATGTYTASLSLTQPGGQFSQEVFVKFSPTAIQFYNGNIPVSGGGANAINVAVRGSGNNAAPTVVTGAAELLTPNNVKLSGTISNPGCTPAITYGIEYSGIDGFAPGFGTKVRKLDIPTTDYTVTLNGLVRGTRYYYRAYASNDGGISYGAQETFKTDSIPAGLVVYSSPIKRGGNLHYSLDNVKPAHYQVKIINSIGQLVYQREIILQVNFIDDNFTLPGNIGRGLYTLQVYNYDFKISKQFFVE